MVIEQIYYIGGCMFDQFQARLEQLAWEAGRLQSLCDAELAALESLYAIAPEEALLQARKTYARLAAHIQAQFLFDAEGLCDDF